MTHDPDVEADRADPVRWRELAPAWRERFANSAAGRVIRRAMELNLPTHGLALAAQQILCTVPLLVAFSAADRRANGQGVGGVLSHYLALSPAASADVTALFDGSRSVSTEGGLIGLALGLGFATAIAATQQRWFELVWSQPRAGGVRTLLRQLLWVGGLCGYLVVVLFAGRAGHGVGRRVHAGRPAGPVVQFGVSFLFFWWSQHLLLSGRVGWRPLVHGATIMALGMTVFVGISGLWMSSEIVDEVKDYGLIGSTFVLSIWLVVLSGVLFSGALLGEQITHRRASR